MIYLMNLIIENIDDIFLLITTLFTIFMVLGMIGAVLFACYETSFIPLIVILYIRLVYLANKKTDL